MVRSASSPRPGRSPPPADRPDDPACPTAPLPPPVRCPPACTPDDPADTTGPAARSSRPPSGSPARRSPSAARAPRTAPPAHPGPHPARSADAPGGLPGGPAPGSSTSMRRAPPRSPPACGPPGPPPGRAASMRSRTPPASGSIHRSADGVPLRAAQSSCAAIRARRAQGTRPDWRARSPDTRRSARHPCPARFAR